MRRGAEVQRCRGAQVHRCTGAQVHRCRGAQVHRCRCISADKVQRCILVASAEVQVQSRYRGLELEVQGFRGAGCRDDAGVLGCKVAWVYG